MKKNKEFQLTKLVEHLSHELRTPLSAILGYSEILEKSKNLDEAEKNHLEKIAASGGQLLDVINDIIEISNIESGNVEAEENLIERETFVEEVGNKFHASARLKEIDLTVKVSSNIGKDFYGDEKKIKTILFSLINNAIKFTEKGKVSVTISAGRKTANGKSELLVNVTDSGIGISKEGMKHIFEPFWQVNAEHKGGTGLGLTTCHKLLSILDGSIDIQSKVGMGTKVQVKIPVKLNIVKTKRIKKNPVIQRSSVDNRGGLKALIVDDLPINRTLARIMLEMKNFETVEAKNGQEALEFYNGEKPDVVLMDISMPIMDGIEAMEKIRKTNGKGKDIPIIAITAGGHTGSRLELIERGFSEYIQKPFKESELFEKISLFLPLGNYKKQQVSLKNPSFTA